MRAVIIANVDVETADSSRGLSALKILRGDLERVPFQNLPPSVDVRFGFDVPASRAQLTFRNAVLRTASLPGFQRFPGPAVAGIA
jgi:hypothetical protein